jgi:hypothetical protein
MIGHGPLEARIAAELERIADPSCRAALEAVLVDPELQHRDWELAPPGARFPTWLIARAHASRVGLAYTEHGYGPAAPWGYVSTGFLTLGTEAQWYPSLEQAFRASGMWTPIAR